jgi:hypothetical protein
MLIFGVMVGSATAELKKDKLEDRSTLDPFTILSQADIARGDAKGLAWQVHINAQERDKISEYTLDVQVSDINVLAVFTEPPRVRGRKLVMHNRNMWFVKPGLQKPVPISPRQKLLGGAAYGDIASTRYAKDYTVQEMKQDRWNDEECFLLQLKAVNNSVTYDRINYWVSKKDSVGVKAEFFTTSGKIFKSAVFEYENTVTFSGFQRPFVSKMIITDALMKDHVTILQYDRIQVKEIPYSVFDLNLLSK